MPMDCVPVDALLIQLASYLQNNYFDNKYFVNWSDDAADVIFPIE